MGNRCGARGYPIYCQPAVYQPQPVIYRQPCPVIYSQPQPVYYQSPPAYYQPQPIVYSQPQPVYYQSPPVYHQPQPIVYSQPQPVYYQSPPVYCPPPQSQYTPPDPLQIQNLKISKPSNSQTYSKVITFDVKAGQVPQITYSGTFSDGSYFTGWDGTLGSNSISKNNSATYIIKETKRDSKTGELKDFYTIGVKQGCNINFKIADKNINYDAPITQPKPPVVQPAPKPPVQTVAPPVVQPAPKPPVQTVAPPVVQLAPKPPVQTVAPIVHPVPKPPVQTVAPPVVQPVPKPPVQTIAPIVQPVPKPPVVVQQPKQSPNVLPLEDSGDVKYPSLHSVFTNNVQTRASKVTYPDFPPSDLKPAEFVKSKDGNYKEVRYGSEYFVEIAREVAEGKGKVSIEAAALKADKTINKNSPHHNPLYRLSTETNHEEVKDFEALFVVGSSFGTTQKNCFRLDAEVTKDAMTRTYGDKCKKFDILEDPTQEEFEEALKARAASAKRNGRKLYIYYSGHGSAYTTQAGVSTRNAGKEGSKEFKYGLDRFKTSPTETYMKNLYKKYLNDVETITIIDACYSGAAVTAIDGDKQRKHFGSLA